MEEKNKKMPFTVPEGYFEKLPQRINQQIVKKEKSPLQAFFSLRSVRLTVPLALVLVLALWLVSPWQSSLKETQEILLALEELPQEEVEAYLLAEGFTEQELLEVFETSGPAEEVLPKLPSLSAEELEEMVDMHDIEILF